MYFTKFLNLAVMFCLLAGSLSAQETYVIKADSVKITNCDSSELILENHTQGVKGFLYNTGNGRTVFKKGVVKINDSIYIAGADTIKVLPPSNFWALKGNVNVDANSNFVGTTDTSALSFRTNNSERMRIFKSGNVGIGTNTELDNTYKMQVNGSLLANGTALVNLPLAGGFFTLKKAGAFYFGSGYKLAITDSDGVSNPMNLRITGSNISGQRSFLLLTDGANQLVVSGPETFFEQKVYLLSGITNQNNADLPITLRQNGDTSTVKGIKFYSENFGATTPIMSIMQTGKVGVGTITPTAQLHTTGTVRFAGLANDNTQTRVVVSDANGNLSYRNLSTWTSNDILRSSLAVDGEIRAKSLRLKPEGWADYVFDSTYHLPALGEVQEFIRRNKHLPGIPSASEVATSGVDVGANQVALLKKIEELTLYVAAQEKEKKDQDVLIADLMKLVKEQGAQLQALKSEIRDLHKDIK